jgi:hypothetical protein
MKHRPHPLRRKQYVIQHTEPDGSIWLWSDRGIWVEVDERGSPADVYSPRPSVYSERPDAKSVTGDSRATTIKLGD